MVHTTDEQERKFNRIFLAVGFFIFFLHIGFLLWVHHLGWGLPSVIVEEPFEIIHPSHLEKFVEVDPTEVEEPPSPETPFFAAANQQAKQMEPVKDNESSLPQNLNGEEDAHKIIDGSLQVADSLPNDFMQENFENQESQQHLDCENSAPDQNLESDYRAQEGENFTEKDVAHPEGSIELLDLEKIVADQNCKAEIPLVKTRPKPKSRLRIESKVTSIEGPLLKNLGGSNQKGLQAVDARFSAYGEYLQKMSEVIYSQWIGKINQVYPNIPRNCDVLVSFMLNSDGSVDTILTEAGTVSSLAICICRDTIVASSPFDPWTESMRGTLGNSSQLMKIHFSFH